MWELGASDVPGVHESPAALVAVLGVINLRIALRDCETVVSTSPRFKHFAAFAGWQSARLAGAPRRVGIR